MDVMKDTNKGFLRRSTLTANSNVIEKLGHLHADKFNQETFLMNGAGMGIKLVRAKD